MFERPPIEGIGRRVVAEVLDGLMQLGLDGGDRLADVPRLELGELRAVRDDRVGQRVEEPGALGARRPPPVAVERCPRGVDGSVDVRLAGHRGAGQKLARRGLVQLADVAGCRPRPTRRR